jgi:hypothetical protein
MKLAQLVETVNGVMDGAVERPASVTVAACLRIPGEVGRRFRNEVGH